jgi:hypothetical protein
MHIYWSVWYWCPPGNATSTSGMHLSPRRESSAWESCLSSQVFSERTCPVKFAWVQTKQTHNQGYTATYDRSHLYPVFYNLIRRNNVLEITYLAHTLLYLSKSVTNYQLLYMFLSSIFVAFFPLRITPACVFNMCLPDTLA